MVRIEEYCSRNGLLPFKLWFESLDVQASLLINTVLTRMKMGNASNIKSVGNGVFERVIDQGPGYRIYFGKEELNFYILLGGGTKRNQQRDIDRAQQLWKEYKNRKYS